MNLSILVGSCDQYSFLWDKFIYLFNKYWSHSIKIDKFLLTENLYLDNNDFKTIATGNIPWTQRLKFALDKIDTDYVLWLQDDYFFIKNISSDIFEEYFDFITKNDVDRFGIHENSMLYNLKETNNKYFKFSQYSYYTLSLQASIWKKDFLLSCIDVDETPWQFEIDGSVRINSRPHNIFVDIQNPAWYLEAMKRGKHTNDYYEICKREGMDS
jgi:hypothetical protein